MSKTALSLLEAGLTATIERDAKQILDRVVQTVIIAAKIALKFATA